MPSERWYPTDGLLGARKSIDEGHERVHAGKSFSVSHSVSVGTGTACTVMFTTPDVTPLVHFGFAVQGSSSLTVTLEENAFSSAGTTITPTNNYRDFASAASTVVKHTVTYQCAGTVIANALLISTQGMIDVIGGGGFAGQELILKAGTRYLVRAVAGQAATTIIVTGEWYEV